MSPLRKSDISNGEKFRVTLDCVPSRHTPWRRPRDQHEIFLRDLRGLRARRGLGLDEIAVRTGFPADDHAATETGPGLPSLPALGAYLRGCGEPLAIWEDRWRRLKQGGPAALGDLPAGTGNESARDHWGGPGLPSRHFPGHSSLGKVGRSSSAYLHHHTARVNGQGMAAPCFLPSLCGRRPRGRGSPDHRRRYLSSSPRPALEEITSP